MRAAQGATPAIHSAVELSPRHRRIGIIAGEGTLPAAVARAAQERGCDPFIIALSSAPADIENFPHHRVQIGEVGRILRILRREGCTSLVFVGRLRRPNVWRIRVDTGFLRLLPELLPLLKGGDDKVLRGVARFFERRGFEVFGTHQVAPHLLAPAGSFGRVQPSSRDREDMALGLQVLKALGPFDIGQAVAIAHNYVLAVEAAEGTDAMLERCRSLNNWGSASRKGVLVKAPKQGQDLRLDLPAIGPRTVDLAADAGLAGIAVQAGAVLLANSEELVEKADRRGIFLYGVSSGEQPGGE